MRLIRLILLCLIVGLASRTGAVVSSLVADTKSGFVLEAHEAGVQQPPASLTKLMTLYLLFGALERGLVTWSDPLPISEKAAMQPKSKLGLVPGETITVREAVLALIVKSANDVAVVVAEALGQSEENFAYMMTQTAHGLGMRQTLFKNASGLHVDGQVSTAKDMAILSMALIAHFPQYYALFAEPSCSYKGQVYPSHNTILTQYDGAEGLKTGFVSAVGYNVVSTAKQGDTRLVSVVIGEENPTQRDLRAMRLLDKGFHQVAVQEKAQRSGQLKSAFNPLNRRAFIGKAPIDVFLPTMKACVALSRRQSAKFAEKIMRAEVVQATLASNQKGVAPSADESVEQGDCWAIQVGAFKGEDKARRMANQAIQILGIDHKEVSTPQAQNQFFRSRIKGFSQNEADQACRRLKDAQWPCFTIAPSQRKAI